MVVVFLLFFWNFGFVFQCDMENVLLKETEIKSFYDHEINPNSLLIITCAAVASLCPFSVSGNHYFSLFVIKLHVSFVSCSIQQLFCGTYATESFFVSSVRSSYSHPDLLLIQHPLFQITPVLNTGLSLSEPLQLYKGYNAI